MQETNIRKLLKLSNSVPAETQNRKGWVVSSCPFGPWLHGDGVDSNPSFGISISSTKKSIHHCWSCNASGDLDDLLLNLRVKLQKAKHEGYDLKKCVQLIAAENEEVELDIPDYESGPPEHDKIVIFPEWWLDSFIHASTSPAATEYLKSRGITHKTIDALDLRYDTMQQRVCFPIRDWQGNLVGLHGRTIRKDEPHRYNMYGFQNQRNKLPWLGEHWVDLNRTVVLVESVFDLAKVYHIYDNVMCGLTAGLSKKKILRISDIADIVTLYDHGKGGDAAREALTKYLKKSSLVHEEPYESEKDPGEMTYKRIHEVLSEHISLAISDKY